MTRAIRVLLADDHDLVVDGLVAALAPVRDIEVVARASDGLSALRLARAHRPDVAVLDLHMPARSAFDVTRALTHEHSTTAVLVITGVDDDVVELEARVSGARGLLRKSAGASRLVDAIRELARGGTCFAPAVGEGARARLQLLGIVPPRRENPLTPRERDVLRLVATGLSNAEIAAQLGLREGTVKNHTSSVLAKLDARDRTQAVLLALRDGWI